MPASAVADKGAICLATVKSMEDTIALLHREAPGTRVFVGGAVLTEDFSRRIGADYYARDTAASAHIAAEVLGA